MKIRLMHPAVGEIAFPLKPGGSLVVGRLGSMADVEISWDPRISRRHCRLWEKDGRVWFQDLASRNGSWIGSDRVTGVIRLAPGASVLIGETVLLLPDGRAQGDPEVEETHERPAKPEELAQLEAAAEPPPSTRAPVASEGAPLEPSEAGRPTPSEEAQEARVPPVRSPTLPARSPLAPEVPIEEPVDDEPDGTVIASPTMDLRRPSEATPLVPEPEPRRVVRGNPRFVSSSLVKVRARDREDLRDLWMRDISKGGLFVETRTPPPPGTQIEVQLETPAGVISLRGTVVHVLSEAMAAGFGGEPGVGVQFLDLDPSTRDAIQAYVEGLAERLHSGGSTDLEPTLSPVDSDEILQRARRFLHDAERGDFYAALDLKPTATRQRIDEVAAAFQHRLSDSVQRIAPPQAARLEAALTVLARVRRIMTHEEGRLEYDFRNGHIRAKDRIQAAKAETGPSLSVLRQAWNRVYPDRVDRAALLTRKAFAARQRQDLAGAIDAGRAALDLNPFFEELRQTVEVWESAGERRH